MKKDEILVEDGKATKLTSILKKLPYVKESQEEADLYTLASEESLGEDWNSEEDTAFQKLSGK